MQIVRHDAQIVPALAAARRLAESAFGDGALLLERYLEAPRHIEVQVFADRHGQYVHLGERDCSIQRRHQKLIEEAPAPQLPEELRARLRAAALAVARAVDYVGAGTVEFLYEAGEFYFMEMNTRLQVEHTVTEAITGLDLVEWQLRVAAGEPLPLTQEQIRFSGHAIEARVCAEDPQRGFLPSAGELSLLEWPAAEHVRVDEGFVSGDRVPESYDSLLGKVIAWAETREVAAARLAAALDATYCVGVHSNEHWLARVLRDAHFLNVQHSIAFLDAAGGKFAPAPLAPGVLVLAALARLLPPEPARPDASPWAHPDGFTPNLPAAVTLRFSADAHTHQVELQFQDGRPVRARVDGGTVLPLHEVSRRGAHLAARLGAQRLQARLFSSAAAVHLWTPTEHVELTLDDPRTQQFAASAASGGLTTPLPGVVVSVPVKVGDAVAAGTVVMLIEAMKMEHAITAPHAGTVSAIHFAAGERVSEGSPLLEIAPRG
jgi:3-methylcrotonyl-CoA carboxylase alpha subunit